MRNLAGFRFPHVAPPYELAGVAEAVEAACLALGFDAHTRLTTEERDALVASRLISPDFDWLAPGCSVFVDQKASVSIMVNEEDHLRVQALTGGWDIDLVLDRCDRCLDSLGKVLKFAYSPKFGFLAASPYNTGSGRRMSAMFHLVGLAQLKRVESVMKALAANGLVVRGAFGESTRAVGAFVQVSLLNGAELDFRGACEYLINEESQARLDADRSVVEDQVLKTIEFCRYSTTFTLGEAMRMLGWLRWAAADGIGGVRYSVADVDSTLSSLGIRSDQTAANSGAQRAAALHALIE